MELTSFRAPIQATMAVPGGMSSKYQELMSTHWFRVAFFFAYSALMIWTLQTFTRRESEARTFGALCFLARPSGGSHVTSCGLDDFFRDDGTDDRESYGNRFLYQRAQPGAGNDAVHQSLIHLCNSAPVLYRGGPRIVPGAGDCVGQVADTPEIIRIFGARLGNGVCRPRDHFSLESYTSLGSYLIRWRSSALVAKRGHHADCSRPKSFSCETGTDHSLNH